jgi:hypothetical protein
LIAVDRRWSSYCYFAIGFELMALFCVMLIHPCWSPLGHWHQAGQSRLLLLFFITTLCNFLV